MLLENQWFWLAVIAAMVIFYLIISKICETIEHIKIINEEDAGDTAYKINSKTMSFKSLEELDSFIAELNQFRNEIINEKSNEEE